MTGRLLASSNSKNLATSGVSCEGTRMAARLVGTASRPREKQSNDRHLNPNPQPETLNHKLETINIFDKQAWASFAVETRRPALPTCGNATPPREWSPQADRLLTISISGVREFESAEPGMCAFISRCRFLASSLVPRYCVFAALRDYVPSIRAMVAHKLPATYQNDYNEEGCGRLLRLLHPAP